MKYYKIRDLHGVYYLVITDMGFVIANLDKLAFAYINKQDVSIYINYRYQLDYAISNGFDVVIELGIFKLLEVKLKEIDNYE